MKVVKLDRRHRLGKQGFTHAFRFEGYESSVVDIEKNLSTKYGYSWNNEKCWGSYWGKKSVNGSRLYWIGFRNEQLVTQTLLSLK
jgi:hypothetical protein